jgi:hypothetical protein
LFCNRKHPTTTTTTAAALASKIGRRIPSFVFVFRNQSPRLGFFMDLCIVLGGRTTVWVTGDPISTGKESSSLKSSGSQYPTSPLRHLHLLIFNLSPDRAITWPKKGNRTQYFHFTFCSSFYLFIFIFSPLQCAQRCVRESNKSDVMSILFCPQCSCKLLGSCYFGLFVLVLNSQPNSSNNNNNNIGRKKRLSTLSPFGLLFILPSREQCSPQE